MKKKKFKFRFMAMSKLIGLMAIAFVFIVVVYTMEEMHNTGNYEALPQLIISAFGFASIYAGFYLTMAKMEHVEAEKTKREKELAVLKKVNASQENIDAKQEEIEGYKQKISEILSETFQSLM
jgi:amino acid permease